MTKLNFIPVLVRLTRIRTSSSLIIFVLAFVLFQLYFLNNYDFQSHLDPSVNSIQGGGKSKIFIDQNEQDTDYVPIIYSKLIKKYKEKNINIGELTLNDKCSNYFQELYNLDGDWLISDFTNYNYDRFIFESKNQFIENQINQFKNTNEYKEIPEGDRESHIKDMKHFFSLDYQKAVGTSKILENQLTDTNTHLRVFGSCFLNHFNNEIANIDNKMDLLCHDVESRMYPWLTKVTPTYTRWDGTTTNKLPQMSKYINTDSTSGKVVTREPKEPSVCYLQNLQNSLNGKGLIVSVSDNYVDQMINLIGSLRAIGNELPIQVVHIGDLSPHSAKALAEASRNIDDISLEKIDNLNYALLQKNITQKAPTELSREELAVLFPQQEIWFVDISKSVKASYRKKFKGYGNKLLAFFFNSFEHAILIDTDTVPMVNFNEHILNSTMYEESGAYFFRDRELRSQLRNTDVKFYKKLIPSTIDTGFFNIPTLTDKVLKNRFFAQRFEHFMESGVVAIDRKKHFTSVLLTVNLQLWHPVTTRVWGDKELFWLGMSMAGDESFYMNYWPAGTVGQITPQEHRNPFEKDEKKRTGLIANEICSTHPAHLSSVDNTTLLWFNSGFQFCKQDPETTSKTDLGKGFTKNWYKNSDELYELYSNYHKIEAMIIPKHQEYFVKTDNGENTRGWVKESHCKQFMYCAYDKVGGRDLEESNGVTVKFDEDLKKLYNFYGSVNQHAGTIFADRLFKEYASKFS